MDRFIKAFAAVPDADLMLCEGHGVAYQTDMTAGRVPYGDDYLAKVDAYEDTPIARAVVAGRCAMLNRHLPTHASVLDIGCGSGAFVASALAVYGYQARGFDVIPAAAQRMRLTNCYADHPADFDAVTLWDSLEHMETPENWLVHIRHGAKVFCSLPVFDDLTRIRESKHYRPGEHLYYFTASGFVAWMARHGFRCLEQSTHETDAGRESIGAFAFVHQSICDCGGEVQLEWFDPIKRPVEWFMRCRKCLARGDSTASESEAQIMWEQRGALAA